MLPDYPRAKKELTECVSDRFRSVIRAFTLDIASEPVLEGDSASYTRDDGSGETLEFQQFESTIAIDDAEYLLLTWRDILKRVEECAAQVGKNMFLHMLEKIEAVTKETGNRVDAGGEFTPEKFLELLARIEIQFDCDGNAMLPTIIGGEEASRAFQKIFQEIASSRDLQKKLGLVMETQKERWRDRESARKLVD